MDRLRRKITFLTKLGSPRLEVIGPSGSPLYFPFEHLGAGRVSEEKKWVADIELLADQEWRFRILQG
ncbi:MAG: hypothetical protein AAF633_21210, partial [Chloroflexota bacterium]